MESTPAAGRSAGRSAPDRMWNGLNTTDRKSERRQRLIAAGIEIVGTRGVQAANVRSICRESKVSERHFYEAFTNKDDFVLAVYNQVVEDALSLMAATAADGATDRRSALTRLVAAWVDFVNADGRRGRIIAVEAAANHTLAQRGREVASMMLQFFLDHTSLPSPTTRPVRHDAAAMEVAATVLVTGVWGLLLAWLNDGLTTEIGRDDLVDQIVELILRSLPV